jgi:L-threonylcarbamoyladenylate synthase
MENYWPGPLTIVLNAKMGLSRYLTAGTGHIAVRIPGDSFALTLARKSHFPITATSANPSGVAPASNAQDILKHFGESIDLVIDGGHIYGSEPSTIVAIASGQVKILRKGIIKKVEIN